MRFTPSPELLRIGSKYLDHNHPSARAFSVINNAVVAMTPHIHLFIFSALRSVIDDKRAPYYAKAVLKRHGVDAIYQALGVSFYPQAPSQNDLEWFRENAWLRFARAREVTMSGRAWRNVCTRGIKSSVVSFWVESDEVTPAALDLIIKALRLTGLIYVEYMDSPEPLQYAPDSKPA